MPRDPEMMTRRSKEMNKPSLSHVCRNDDGSYEFHHLEEHVRAVGKIM